jgi:hypothetical protein
MLSLNRSLLNREYTAINVLKALASIIYMCSIHVILLSKIAPWYFKLFTNWMFRPCNVRWDSGDQHLRERSNHVSIELRPRCRYLRTKHLRSVACRQCHRQRDKRTPGVLCASFIYTLYNIWDRTELEAPRISFPLAQTFCLLPKLWIFFSKGKT